MRLGKRIGLIGLTLMLAASLLTGCGDNNTPPSGNDALSKPGQSNSGMENTGSSSSGTGSGSTGDKTDTPTISKGGRAVKYFNRRDKMTRYNYKVKVEQTENGKTTTSIEQAVTDGRRYSIRLITGTNEKEESAFITDTRTMYTYGLQGDIKHVYRSVYRPDGPSGADPEFVKSLTMIGDPRSLTYPMTTGKQTVEGVLYYTETYTVGLGGKLIYCFDLNDLEGNHLRYIFSDSPDRRKMKIKFLEDTTTVDPSLLQIPEGWTMYDANDDGSIKVETACVTPKDNYPN